MELRIGEPYERSLFHRVSGAELIAEPTSGALV